MAHHLPLLEAILLLIALASFASGFVIYTSPLPLISLTPQFTPTALFRDDETEAGENENDDDDDGGECSDLPYRSRSLSWTNRFRKLIPYETARLRVISMGFRSKQEWDEFIEDGQNGPYLPNHPDEMYVDDWTSWEEFLGLMRPLDDARTFVQSVLQMKTLQEYRDFIQQDPKRAQCLRIPWQPHIVYKDEGWISYDDFFGTMQ